MEFLYHLRILVVFLPVLIYSSVLHHLMLAVVIANEILKSLFHIVGQCLLAEYILVHSHVLMFEVGWQEFVKMTYHILYLLYSFWIVASQSLFFNCDVFCFCKTFDNAKMLHFCMVVLMKFTLCESFF